MPDSESKHVIRYVLELDESDIKKRAEEAARKVTGGSAGSAPSSGGAGTGSSSGGAVAGAPGPAEAAATKKHAETIGETMAKKFAEFFQQHGTPSAIASGAASDLTQTLAGSGGLLGRAMGLPSQLLSGAGGAMAAAAIPLAVVAAVGATLYGLKVAADHAVQALGQLAQALTAADPNAVIGATGSGLKAAGAATAAVALTAFPPAMLLGGALYALGAVVDQVSGVMNGMLSTFGQFNAAIIGQMRVSDLMFRMLKIQIASYLQPAMEAWIKLLQDVMSVMSAHPEIWKTINALLVNLIGAVSAVVHSMMEFLLALFQLAEVTGLFNELRGGLALFTFCVQAATEALKVFLNPLSMFGGGSAPVQSGNLKANALQFNRAFVDQMLGGQGNPQGAGAPLVVGGPAGVVISGQPRPRIPMPNLPKFETKIALSVQQSIMHEKAVQIAVEQIKDRLFRGLKTARDETALTSLMIDGHSAGYGL